MDITTVRVLVTVISVIAFLGIAYWAFRPKNKKRFEQDAQIPFDSDGPEGGQR